MRSPLLAIFVCFLFASKVWAQEIAVRSGEHADFSRLVVDFPSSIGWSIEVEDRNVLITPSKSSVRYGLESVFRYIPRDRIVRLQGSDTTGALRIEMASDVKAEWFALSSGAAVIDFRFIPADAVESAHPTRIPSTVFPSIQTDYFPLFWENALETQETVNAPAPDTLPVGNTYEGGFEMPDPRIQQMEAELLAQLSRAAAQGLVEVDASPRQNKISESNTPKQNGSAVPDEGASATDAALAVTSQTSIDRATGTRGAQDTAHSVGLRCPPAEAFDVTSWADSAPPATLIGQARRALMQEFDRLDREQTLTLARIYAALGFGAEARNLLRASDFDDADTWSIMLVSAVTDGFAPDGALSIDFLVGCDGPVALWAFLAGNVERQTPIKWGAIQRAYSALPAHLRGLLGPSLVEKLMQHERFDIAHSIRDSLARIGSGVEASLSLVDAHVGEIRSNDGQIVEGLEAAIAEDGAASIPALLILIEDRLTNGEAVPARLTENAGAISFELGTTTEGLRLLRGHVLGLGSVGSFDQGFEALDRWPHTAEPELRNTTLEHMFEFILRIPYDTLFLQVYFRHRDHLENGDISDETRLALGQRLITQGLSEAARNIINPESYQTDEARALLARSALAEGDASSALSHLRGLEDESSLAMKAEAYQMLGLFGDATDIQLQRNEVSLAGSAAWLNGDWGTVGEVGSDTAKNFVRAFDLIGPDERLQDAEPITAANLIPKSYDLVQQSRAEREALDALLLDLDAEPQESFTSAER